MNQNLTSAYFVSLGCSKNLVDSQVMIGLLQKDGFTLSKDADQADVIIVNTCSFIQAAKEESIETILEMAAKKETAQCKALVVSGCLAQRYSDELKKEMPEIDLMIGTGQYHRIAEFLSENKKALEIGTALPQRVYIDQPAFIHTEKDPRVHTGPRHSAYLKLSEGCNRNCTFCIIPTLRGEVRSRSVDSLVLEAKNLAAQGVKELNLIAQDLTHYGIDLSDKENLEVLLPRLCLVDGIEWIRLHYVYPDQLSSEIIDIIAREPKIVKYLDMPIQHTNDRILRLMGRKLRKKRLFNLMEEMRAKIPEVVIRTSIIVGFPGETNEEFEELCNDLITLQLDHVGVFRYSKEEGTAAAKLLESVSPMIRRSRSKKLIALLQEQALLKKQKYLNKEVDVLVEGMSGESELLLQGRMSTQAEGIDGHILINDIEGFENIQAGDIVKVKVTEVLPHDLVGRIVQFSTPYEVRAEQVI